MSKRFPDFEEWFGIQEIKPYMRSLYGDGEALREKMRAAWAKEKAAFERDNGIEPEEEPELTFSEKEGLAEEPSEEASGEAGGVTLEMPDDGEDEEDSDGGDAFGGEDAEDESEEDEPEEDESEEDESGEESDGSGKNGSGKKRGSLYGEAALRKARREEKKEEKRKKREGRKYVLRRIGALSLAVLTAVLLLLIIANSVAKSIRAEEFRVGYLTRGEVVHHENANAYFLRNSEPLLSPKDGVFVAGLEEGKRVEAGGVVGYVTTGEYRNVVAKLRQVSASILALQGMGPDEVSEELAAQLSEIEKQMKVLRGRLVELSRGNSLEEAEEIADQIDALIKQKVELIVNSESENNSIAALKRQKEELEGYIETKMVPVISAKAGVVSYYFSDTDNIEAELCAAIRSDPENVKFSALSLIRESTPANVLGQEVTTGATVARIVTDQEYYIVLETEAEVKRADGTATVETEDQSFRSTGNVAKRETKDGFVILKTLRGLKSSMQRKTANVRFEVDNTSGYCVPLSALTDWDDNGTTARLAIVKAGYVEFVHVGIKAKDNEKAIITDTPFGTADVIRNGEVSQGEQEGAFAGGDCYVINAQKVKEGQQIA